MQWIDQYQLFLFDFDGLLVNTEQFHYLAYRKMCEERGVKMEMPFEEYCTHAHYEDDGLKKGFYAAYPDLYKQEPDWSVLYQEKKKHYIDLIFHHKVNLMPGVKKLLESLEEKGIKRCVVTHSPLEQIKKIRGDNPILDTIPYWLTREDYSKAKPNPECYLKAIEQYSVKGDRMIGFEDTPRGLKALLATPAEAVWVTTIHYPDMQHFIEKGARHVETIETLVQFNNSFCDKLPL